MRYKLTLLLLIGLCSCSVNKLNLQIDSSQRLSIKESPFECASSMYDELKIQKKYRAKYINEIEKLIELYPNDTLYLLERYDFICFGCPSDDVEIYINSKYITYEKKFDSKSYVRKEHEFSFNKEKEYKSPRNYPNYDIVRIKRDLRAGKKLSRNANLYGTEECLDGGHTFYTVILPKKKFETLYMRCWTWDPWEYNYETN